MLSHYFEKAVQRCLCKLMTVRATTGKFSFRFLVRFVTRTFSEKAMLSSMLLYYFFYKVLRRCLLSIRSQLITPWNHCLISFLTKQRPEKRLYVNGKFSVFDGHILIGTKTNGRLSVTGTDRSWEQKHLILPCFKYATDCRRPGTDFSSCCPSRWGTI